MLAEPRCPPRHGRSPVELERAAERAEAVLFGDHHPTCEHVRLLQRFANAKERSRRYSGFAKTLDGVFAREVDKCGLDLVSKLDAVTRALRIGRKPPVARPI